MKKIMTLLVCLGAVTLASAQNTREMEDVKDIILGPRKTDGNTRSGDKDVVLGRDDRRVENGGRTTYPRNSSRSTEANRINREYDAKIGSIENNRTLSRAEKERAIRQLESDRNRKLRSLNERYSKDRRYNDRDDDRRYSKNKNYKKGKKGNNGKHLGWEKGKGNPHKERRN